jgi:vacuolar-type H+-ATPase subunit I/STV1
MLKLIQTRVETWGNDPVVRGRVIGLLGAVLLIIANQGVAYAQSPGGMEEALASLAKMLIDGLVALSALLLAIGLATGFLTGMVEVMAGRPGGLSSTWMRIIGVVLCFVGAIFTITIANTIIDTLKTYKSTGGISLP